MTVDSAGTVDVANDLLANNAKLKAIAKDISDTAVDIFVYDTRKDSDGGAWRKRTQNTSWYNEALNTSTRGARKEFPSVAVIVAEASQVTIYDGDDPDMPMWMVFNQGNSFMVYTNGNALSGITALDGSLCWSGFRVGQINFAKDFTQIWEQGYYDTHHNGISGRNAAGVSFDSTGPKIVNNTTNDIAMTVLPNAPIDAETGLPVPTIAVATNGGISLINDNGVVVNYTNLQDSSTFNFCDNVFFRGDGAMVWQADSTGNSAAERFTRVVHVPRKSGTFVESSVAGSSALDEFYAPNQYAGDLRYIQTPTGVLASSRHGKAGLAAGQAQGLNIISPNRDTPTEGLINYITSDYNTGWMNGDIKLATLSDTDTTNAVGTELITNGTFASNTTGWTTNSNGTFVSSGGVGVLTNTQSGDRLRVYDDFVTVIGKTYTVSFTMVTTGLFLHIGNTSGGAEYAANLGSTVGTHSFTFVATTTLGAIQIGLYDTTNNATASIDNVSVRLAEEDRSYNGNGLQVFGTVTKTAVATGAELVGYSGFNSNNYLRQPYNADLQFGTGSFSIMGWYKVGTVSSTYRCLVYINSVGVSSIGNTNHGFQLLVDPNERLYSYIYGPGTDGDQVSVGDTTDGAWHMFCHVTSNQSSHKLYIDGIERASSTSTIGNINNTNAQLMLGAWGGNSAGAGFPFTDGNLANIRISKTAPTAEQIAKMYNDEKHLFATNAKATLYGTSDAVTALAYDDDTELLHVGTSAGRSVFQGLNRVDNTTDAVGAAISASNGFIVEE